MNRKAVQLCIMYICISLIPEVAFKPCPKYSVHMSTLHRIIDQAFPIFHACTQYTTRKGLGMRLHVHIKDVATLVTGLC